MNRGKQVVDANSWHGRIYLRTLAMMDFFIVQSSESNRYSRMRYSDYFGDRTSFCHYWRMIAVYSWLVPLCYITTVVMAVEALIVYPVQHFGWFGSLWLIGIPLLGIAIVAGIIVLVVLVVEETHELSSGVISKAHSFALGTTSKEGLTFFQVLVGRLIAFKYGMCPIIEIKRSSSKEAI